MELDEAFWLLSLQLIVIFSHFKFYWLILSQALHPKLISHFKKSILWILWHEACSVLPRYVFHDGRSCTFFFFSVLPPWKWTKKISVPYKNTKLGKLSALDSLLCIICVDAYFALEIFFFPEHFCWWAAVMNVHWGSPNKWDFFLLFVFVFPILPFWCRWKIVFLHFVWGMKAQV